MRAAVVCLLVFGCSSNDRLDQCSGVSDPCVTFHLVAEPKLVDTQVNAIKMWMTYNAGGQGERNDVEQTPIQPFTRFPIAVGLQLPQGLTAPTKVRIEALTGPGPAAYKVVSVAPAPGQHLDVEVMMVRPEISGCFDGGQDPDETDVDCGRECLPCAFSRRCLTNADCESSSCNAGFCQ